MQEQFISFRYQHIIKIVVTMQRPRQIRAESEPVFSNIRRYPGIIADPTTGKLGTGIPYLEYLQFLTNNLNKNQTNGKLTPVGHVIINQNPSHFIRH